MMALALLSIASAGLLMGVSSSMQTTDDSIQNLIAQGMAQQLMDELSGMRYMEVGQSPTYATLGPEAGETIGPGRSLFDDIDDYNGVVTQPPTDRWGIPLGQDDGDGTQRDPAFQMANGYFAKWRQQVDVFYVLDTAPTTPLAAGTTSNYRAARVRIFYDDPQAGTQTLADQTRVFSYVPSP
jgi:type II secretory pathway pseudopilin PulG